MRRRCCGVSLIFALVLRTSALASEEAAASLLAAGPTDDQGYLQKTYNFLRKKSDNIGSGIQSMLDVQSSLDDVAKRLDNEYAAWKDKKKGLLGERDRLAMDLARLQAASEVLRAKKADKERLQRERDVLQHDNAQMVADNDKAYKRRMIPVVKVKRKAAELESFANKTQIGKDGAVAATRAKSLLVRNTTRVIQREVFDYSQRVLQRKTDRTDIEAANNKTHKAILVQIAALQERFHNSQGDLIGAAQLRQQTRDFRAQVVSQASQTMAQRNAMIALQSNCSATLLQMDHHIREAKLSLQGSNQQLTVCQELDGQNQQLQAELSHCSVLERTPH